MSVLRRKRKRLEEEEEEEEEENAWEVAEIIKNTTILASAICSKPPRKRRRPNKNRTVGKIWWDELYANRSDEEFKEKLRVNMARFNAILEPLKEELTLQPINLNPYPTSPDR